jgi:L-alanine-DL-glutamate epimerase-like enolase superfamily enzyme
MRAPVRLQSLTFGTLAIPFTTRFRHAAAERAETSTVWITAESAGGVRGAGESCPRPYVTGETLASAEAFFSAHREAIVREVDSFGALAAWVRAHETAIDLAPAAWCAIELAILDVLGRSSGEPLEAVLSLPPLTGAFEYTAVIGDADLATFTGTAERYRAVGFRDFKVKLSGDLERDRQKLDVLAAGPADGTRVRLDANNLWSEPAAAVEFVGALGHEVFAVEEPVGAGRYDELAWIADRLGVAIVLDESVTRRSHIGALAPPLDRWIVNLRVSKMGGLLRSLDLVRTAQAAGVRVIVGAQVGETSLLTRAGLSAAHAAGTALVAQEGAFGTLLLSRDVCDPPLMFGAGGRLAVDDHPRLSAPGLGIEPDRAVESRGDARP